MPEQMNLFEKPKAQDSKSQVEEEVTPTEATTSTSQDIRCPICDTTNVQRSTRKVPGKENLYYCLSCIDGDDNLYFTPEKRCVKCNCIYNTEICPYCEKR